VPNYQHAIFNWVAGEAGLTGAAIFAAGLLATFCGNRFLRFLLVVIGGELGYAVAAALTAGLGWTGGLVPYGALALGAVGALARPRVAAVVASGVTWGLLGAYLATQLGARGPAPWAVLALSGSAGILLAVVSRPTMSVVLTSLHGAAWMIVGFVGVSVAVTPAIGVTFQSWAEDQSLVVPVLLAMLLATGYSCQANSTKGDMRVGQLQTEQTTPTGRTPTKPRI
jgi:hypothetical protein